MTRSGFQQYNNRWDSFSLNATYISCRVWLETLPQGIEREFESVPYLVAKVPIAQRSLDVQVDVVPLRRVGAEGEPHGVCPTLGDPVRIVGFLHRDRYHHYKRAEVSPTP